MKTALISGITGQDGSYMAELLLAKGYKVHGIIRRSSTFNTDRIDHIYEDKHNPNKNLMLHYGDLTDAESINKIMQEIKPDEVYNLGAQSHVRVSFDIPAYTTQSIVLGTLHLLEAMRKYAPQSRFYQASSSEMFGKVQEVPQTEKTKFYPRSPYGCAKVFGHGITINYRESYGLFACNGILFNHESPRRGATFVTRKISRAVAETALSKENVLYLGNLNAKRDWGYAPEYVEAMWRILQQEEPQDYVIATGETHSVREFVEAAYQEIGIEIRWVGTGVEEKGYNKSTGKLLISIDQNYYRPAEVDLLIGSAQLAKEKLGWEPKVKFKELVKILVQVDIINLKDGTSFKYR